MQISRKELELFLLRKGRRETGVFPVSSKSTAEGRSEVLTVMLTGILAADRGFGVYSVHKFRGLSLLISSWACWAARSRNGTEAKFAKL